MGEESSDELKMDETIETIDANEELEQLEKKLNMLKKKNKIIDGSRMASVEQVKKQTPYQASIQAGYGTKKHARENKRGNIDIEESEKKARKMSRRITGDVNRSGLPDKLEKNKKAGNAKKSE